MQRPIHLGLGVSFARPTCQRESDPTSKRVRNPHLVATLLSTVQIEQAEGSIPGAPVNCTITPASRRA